MDYHGLRCQMCITKHKGISDYKKHLRSPQHRQKTQDVFPEETFNSSGVLPHIYLMHPQSKDAFRQHVTDLTVVSLCFTLGRQGGFYLCHVCEEKCPQDVIVRHVLSADHRSNYINYTDPNMLNFSWIPCKNVKSILSPKDMGKRVPGHLQMLHLSLNLLEKLESSTYSEVMQVLSENSKFLKLIEATLPKRVTIETYQKDSERKHPLLGMQHLVECICVGPGNKRHYLCTLCSLTVPAHMIIKHVLSFDHIFGYFKAWHPNTLLSKECYRDYTTAFASTMRCLSEQTQKIHGTESANMKQVIMEPAEFNSVDFTCYTEALKKLESIKKSSLTTTVTPGNKLGDVGRDEDAKKPKGAKTVSPSPFYQLRCQDCNTSFERIGPFMKHLFRLPHQQNMKKHFSGDDYDGYNPPVRVHLGIYSYIECKKAVQPAVGVSLVVTIITTHAELEPAYLCFACQDCFFESCLEQHFSSRKHLINTLLYQNPWRLPFAWEKDLDEAELRSMAWEEQKERGANQMMVKVLDLPYSLFMSLNPLDFPTVMRTLTLQHTLLKREVPPCKTYSKLHENERFPQLGKQFMIIYTDVPEPENEFLRVRFLCLLCERKLLEEEFYGHVFSREHVENFLNRFHPGSLNSSTDDANVLLDLAKQAGRFHRILHVQAIQLDTPIWEPCSYRKTKLILANVNWRKGKGKLEPSVKTRMKLVPRKTLKELNSGQQGGTVQQNDTNELCVKNEHHIEKEEEMPTTNEKESQTAREVYGAGSEEKNADETCQVKKEKTEELSVSKPSGEIPESGQNTDKEDGADAGIERRKSDENVPSELKDRTFKMSERKRPNGMSEASHGDTSQDDVGAEVDQKRMRLSSSADACCEESSKMPTSEQKDEKTADMNETYKAATDKGLSTLLKCHCENRDPIYLCESCTLRIPENDVISHITSLDHQRMFLMVVKMDEEDYSEISKLSHESAIQRVKAIQAQQDSRCELPSTSASHSLKSEDTSEDHTEDMDIDEDSDSEAAPDMSVMTEITSKTVLSELKEDDTVIQIQEPLLTDNSDTCLTVFSSNKEKSSLCVTTCGTSTTRLAPENTNNDLCIMPTVESLKMSTSSEIEEFTASISISTATTSTCVVASGTTSASSVPVLMTTSTMSAAVSAAVSALVKSKSDLASKVKATSQTGPSVVHEAPSCRIESHPKYSQSASKITAPSPTVAAPVEVKHRPETSVSASENTEASAKTLHVRNSVGATASVAPHIHKSSPPEAPHLTTDMSALSEHKKLEVTDTKPKEFPQKIGASQVIIVTCNGKRQVYCRLCSVRMQNSQHLMDIKHQQKYVLLRCPGWTAEPSEWESKLSNTLARLAQAEKRYMSSETIEVKSDVYKALSELPEDKAVEQLKTMVRQKSLLSTDSAAGQGLGVTSPCEVSSSDDGIPIDNPSAYPPVTGSELVDIFAQIPQTFFEESTADTEQQSHSSHNEEHEPDLRSEPANPSALQTFPRILIGETTTYGSNRLSWFLSVNKMDSQPVIGLRSVWECRGISLNPFYLCESCRKTLSLSEICKHLVSAYHHLHCMLRHYPQFMKWVEEEKDLLLEMKYELLNDIAQMVSVRERFYKHEAQGIMLAPTSYERVRTAPFNEALKIVQKIKSEEKLTAFYPPSSTPQQKSSHLKKNAEESLPTEMQSMQAPKTNQRSDKDTRRIQR